MVTRYSNIYGRYGAQSKTDMLIYLTFLLLNTTCPILANSVDPGQLASSEAN